MNRRKFIVGSAASVCLVAGCLERAEDVRRAVEDDEATATPSRDDRETRTEDDGEAGQGTISIAGLRADADANDDNNLNDEYVTYENTGDDPLGLTDWTVRDEDGTTYTFPDGFVLDPSETVTLYTGRGTDTESELYWGRADEVWNNGADTMTVRNDRGEIVLQRSYP
jgi:hypothetical protein